VRISQVHVTKEGFTDCMIHTESHVRHPSRPPNILDRLLRRGTQLRNRKKSKRRLGVDRDVQDHLERELVTDARKTAMRSVDVSEGDKGRQKEVHKIIGLGAIECGPDRPRALSVDAYTISKQSIRCQIGCCFQSRRHRKRLSLLLGEINRRSRIGCTFVHLRDPGASR